MKESLKLETMLLVKSPSADFDVENGLPEELYEMDKITHGLITQVIHKGFAKNLDKKCLCIRAESGPIDVMLLTQKAELFTTLKVKNNFPSIKEAFYHSAWNSSETKSIKKHLPKVKLWKEREY